MPRPSKKNDKVLPELIELLREQEPYRMAWKRLTPGERLVRSWALRRFVRDLERYHDEKSLPKL